MKHGSVRPGYFRFFPLALMSTLGAQAFAAKLVECRPVDDEILMIRWLDSEVNYPDDAKGEGPYMGHESRGNDTIQYFKPALNTEKSVDAFSFSVRSTSHPAFLTGIRPVHAYRKTKVSGTSWNWPDPDLSYEHTIFLKFNQKFTQGSKYSIDIASSTGSDKTKIDFEFDVTKNVSEAIHVNLIGYNPSHTAMKSADLYMWLGSGGNRDYSPYLNQKVQLLNVKTKKLVDAGKVKFWKRSAKEYGNWNLTGTDVWTCDFSDFNTSGTYRLVIPGIGSSPEFRIGKDIYHEPYKTSLRGFYYMRIGEPMTLTPPPRQPRFLPGKEPAGFTVYLTTYSPWHPDWKKRGGDQWDNIDWSMYKEPGNPTNPNAYGGHSDALDWDRHCGHISIIWDMLLPLVLSNGKGNEDNLGILESGNKIPDAIDEAQNEVDMWLRLRDTKGGYASGLNNPTKDLKTMYQGAARPYMAWASAANCAMLSATYKLSGNRKQTEKYRDEAIAAWKFANEQDLDFNHTIGNGVTSGRDLKMMAAAYLYVVTGERKFEDAMVSASVIKSDKTNTEEVGKYNQMWAVAGYLMCAKYKWQAIHYPEVVSQMTAAIINESMTKNVKKAEERPSRRSADDAFGWFQSIQEVQRVCVAHAVARNASERDSLLKALILEADYGLGRNPMNMVQMTGLGSRSVGYIYTSGRNDGVPGSHPGHTPYMNSEPWGQNFMANPQYYSSRGYPDWKQWPQGEALWNAPYCFSNNEFTPQQSMRGKHCLYGYLYSLGR
jgi:endoglucanase